MLTDTQLLLKLIAEIHDMKIHSDYYLATYEKGAEIEYPAFERGYNAALQGILTFYTNLQQKQKPAYILRINNCEALHGALQLQDLDGPALFDVRAKKDGDDLYTQYTLEDLTLHLQEGDTLQSFYDLRTDWQLWLTT